MVFRNLAFVTTLLFATLIADTKVTSQVSMKQPNEDLFSNASFENWIKSNKTNAANFIRFEAFLKNNNVYGVVPTYQILRTASDAGICNQSAFEVPPDKFWNNIVTTLKFLKDYIQPELGQLEALSGYRNPVLNACAGGAKKSAHTQYFALDLKPVKPMARKELFFKVCRMHEKFGEQYNIGLGFYSGTRFHIDSKSFRRWGFNGRGKTSPCTYYDLPEDDSNTPHETH